MGQRPPGRTGLRRLRAAAFGVLVLLPGGAGSQTFLGGVRGQIRDAGGGMLPGVTVTLTNVGTGAARAAVSGASGEYAFANIQPGAYRLPAELSAFAPSVQEGLVVGISSFLVVDAALTVGGIEETVTVTSDAPLIETATASVASALDRAQLEVLPTPGRNVFILAVGTPNVVRTGNPVWVKQSDQTNSSLLSLGGGPLRGNNYTVDGISTTDLASRSVIIPVFGAIQEMKVQTNTHDSEMGRTGGGVFNIIHRRGTNRWAGSGLYQFRPATQNTPWRALAWFQQGDFDRGDLTEGDLTDAPYNLGGGAFGGPIRRDRTFFWLSTEGYVDHAIGNATIRVPTSAEAAGDFSGSGATM